jgi:outer membrane murein-binding lipoprotein Lpp
MLLNKKLIIIAVSAAVLLVGSIAGVVLAVGNGDENQAKAQGEDLLAKVCTIYQQKTGVAIDETALKDAFARAGSEMQTEREQARLQDLVTQGKITQDQADQYLKWWQSRPNLPAGFGFRGGGGFHGQGAPCAPPASE